MKIIKILTCIVIAQLAGIIGSLFTTPNIPTWYAGLVKSPLNPPSWVFGPVWTTLFTLMGIALYLVWAKYEQSDRADRKKYHSTFIIFFVQLALNTLWSIIFFGLHNPAAAFIEIIILWLAILATIVTFYKHSKVAAWLLIPYLLWVSFASYLNFSIWQLN